MRWALIAIVRMLLQKKSLTMLPLNSAAAHWRMFSAIQEQTPAISVRLRTRPVPDVVLMCNR